MTRNTVANFPSSSKNMENVQSFEVLVSGASFALRLRNKVTNLAVHKSKHANNAVTE